MDLLKSENDENVTMEVHEACKRGDLDKVANLMKRKEEIEMQKLIKYHTLEVAVGHGYQAIVELLLKIGVNVNQKESFMGIRPLHLACAKRGKLAIAKILLGNG